MDLFTQVKMAVSVKEAAEYYGLEVKRGSMVCCPFHNDRTPSMKLNEDYFYCFGCGATGDVIDLVAKLFNLSSFDAAKKLADDFGIDPDKPPAAAALRKTKYPLAKTFQNETLHCQRILCDYLHLLEHWKMQYAPKTPEDTLDDRFVEACQMLDYIEDLTDILTFAELETRVKTVDMLQKDGRVTDDLPLRGEIYEKLKCCAVNNIPRKITNILEVMKLAAHVEDFTPEADRVHLANGTLKLDGSFTEGRPTIVRSRLPVAYRPDAPAPVRWLSFLDGLLYTEDIPTLQEFIGYCLIPSNKGQRMMVIKGNGGEGKSQIGAVLGALLGSNMKDGNIGKISENRFARADLEHILLCVDDDMRMEALRQTNYVKSIVTAQGKMDLERKGKQSYQGWMFARLLAFSNGDLQALYDRSDGFYRRQLVLTTREKPVGRIDDPDLAEKMKAEAEGIFLWAFEGLQRLVANNFKFTESQRTRDNREAVKRDSNNVFDFLESEGYIRLKADCTISSKDLYEIYRMWCEENNLTPLKRRSFSESVIANQSKYNLEYCNKITNAAGRRVWGFFGIEAIARPNINGFSDVSEHTYVPEDWR